MLGYIRFKNDFKKSNQKTVSTLCVCLWDSNVALTSGKIVKINFSDDSFPIFMNKNVISLNWTKKYLYFKK